MNDNRGVTLVELVVAIAIMSAITLSIYSFYIVGVKGFARETTTATNQVSVRRALNEISRQIRRGESIETEWEGKETREQIKIVFPEDNVEEKVVIYRLNNSNNTIEYKRDSNTWTQLSDRIGKFSVIPELDENNRVSKVTVLIESVENAEGYIEDLETVITIRQGWRHQ